MGDNMLVNANEMLLKASDEKYAIAQFNINNLEWTKFILEECQVNRSPVILGVSEGATKYMGGYNTVGNLVKSLISDLNITIPVCLHLDHGSSFENCVKAINGGFTSVMIDASKFPLNENILITKKVIEYAKKHHVSVEAEVGAIGGSEDGVVSELLYAKIDDVVALVRETNVDFLAPALGSIHGLYKGTPKLDFVKMTQIKEIIRIPLVLHGGTGIPDDLIKKSISCGINKINLNTELQIVWSKAVRKYLQENPDVYDPRKIIKSGEESIKSIVKSKLELFGSINRL